MQMKMKMEKNNKWDSFFEILDENEINEAAAAVKNIQRIRQGEKATRIYEKNTELYAGKTYKQNYSTYLFNKKNTVYCKIISGFSSNPYRISCLLFPEYPSYTYYERFNRESGYWELNSFYVDSILLRDFTIDKKYEEISNEEWESAFNNHIECLKKLKAERQK